MGESKAGAAGFPPTAASAPSGAAAVPAKGRLASPTAAPAGAAEGKAGAAEVAMSAALPQEAEVAAVDVTGGVLKSEGPYDVILPRATANSQVMGSANSTLRAEDAYISQNKQAVAQKDGKSGQASSPYSKSRW